MFFYKNQKEIKVIFFSLFDYYRFKMLSFRNVLIILACGWLASVLYRGQLNSGINNLLRKKRALTPKRK